MRARPGGSSPSRGLQGQQRAALHTFGPWFRERLDAQSHRGNTNRTTHVVNADDRSAPRSYKSHREHEPVLSRYSDNIASLNLTRRDIIPTLTAPLTTIAFDDSSLQRFEACT
jgi:hypothetical protein